MALAYRPWGVYANGLRVQGTGLESDVPMSDYLDISGRLGGKDHRDLDENRRGRLPRGQTVRLSIVCYRPQS
jgi:hypothetical protein